MSADFLDSNILIYMVDETDDRKQNIAATLVYDALENSSAAISFQVIQETLNVLTRKIAVPATDFDARDFLDKVLMPLWKINPGREFYQRGLAIQARHRFSFYDSLIIAAALEHGCTTLYSEDLQHAQQIERLTVKNPFLG
jgi:predicted nucleic acid-binding protein